MPIPALTILYHPALDRIGERVVLRDLIRQSSVAVSRRTPLFSAPGAANERPLADPYLSRSPWHLRPQDRGLLLDPGTAMISIEGRVTAPTLLDLDRLEAGVVVELADRIVLLLHTTRPLTGAMPPRYGMVGNAHRLEEVRLGIERVADLDLPVLVRGETGTGKELVAAAIHRASKRSGSFVPVNLAAIPSTLASAELFGARKGAYTGASHAQPGYLSRADGGTLFLDEIGEAPIDVQAQLLRTLETGEVQTLGSQRPRTVDVRLVTATDADLESRVDAGDFRAPLLHRLSGFVLQLPPLRARREDFGLLFVHFLRRALIRTGEAERLDGTDATHWLAPDVVARLARLAWPGNVRQLRNAVRQLVIASRGAAQLTLDPAAESLLASAPTAATAVEVSSTPSQPKRRKPSSVTDDELRTALRDCRWDLKATATRLGISRTSLYALIEKSPDLRTPKDVPNEEIRRAFEAHGGDHVAMVDALGMSSRAMRRRLNEMGLMRRRDR